MTAKETLWFYGRIRGIKAESLVRKVDKLIKQVGLTKFADRTSGTTPGVIKENYLLQFLL